MTKELKSKVFIPENYKSNLSLLETEIAIKKVKDFFENKLAETLNLTRVSAPLFVDPDSGLNDNLNGVERPVAFDIKEQDGKIVDRHCRLWGIQCCWSHDHSINRTKHQSDDQKDHLRPKTL